MRRLLLILTAVLLAYLVFVGGLTATSKHAIYPYLKRDEVQHPPIGSKLVQGEGFTAWYFEGKSAADMAPILGFSGNTGRPSDVYSRKQKLIEKGHDLLILIYPGSNNAPGDPSEELITTQALKAYDWLLMETGRHPIAYGISLGTGVAVSVAEARPIEGLVLEMPYTSIYDVARNRYKIIPPIDILPDNRWRSIDKIQKIDTPILIVHGEKDQLIPVQHALELYRRSSSVIKDIEIYPDGTHFNLHQFGAEERILKFVMENID